jgi:hypothetical protein
MECKQQGKKYLQHQRVKLAVCNNVTPFYNGPAVQGVPGQFRTRSN